MPAWATLPAVSPGRWRVLSADLGAPGIVVSFPGGSDPTAIRLQLERWRESLARAATGSLVIPRLQPDALNPSIAYPAPAAIGRDGLPASPTPADILAMLGKTAEALDAIHACGIVHGGLGLSSIWWTESGAVCFPDAALAHALEGLVPTPTAAFMYRAPEVWHEKGLVPASDQYSLAALAYELLSGRSRKSESSVEGLAAIEPLLLDAGAPLYPGAPIEMNDVLQRALSAKPQSRYPSCAEFIDALSGHFDEHHSERTVRTMLAGDGRPAAFGAIGLTLMFATIVVLVVGIVKNPHAARDAYAGIKARLPSLSGTPIVVTNDRNATASRLPNQRLPASAFTRPPTSTTPTTSKPSSATQRSRSASGDSPARSSDQAQDGTTRSGGKTPPIITVDKQGVPIPGVDKPLPGINPSVTQNAASRATSNGKSALPDLSLPGGSLPASTPRAAIGTISLDIPKGSRVYVDGVLTKVDGARLSVPEGTHDIDVLGPDGVTTRKRITLKSGDSISIRIPARASN